MRRREFLSLFASVAATWPLAVRAQSQSNEVRRIGMLFGLAENDELGRSYVNVFRERLRELGWIENGNIQIEYRWAIDDPTRIRAYAAELVKLKPAVIVCQSGLTLPALQRETRSIPIVFTVITDPLASGYVTSLAHPGGNITGFANSQVGTEGKLLQILKEIAPGIDRTSVILNSEQAAQIAMLRAIQAAASSLGVPVAPIDVRNSTDFSEVISCTNREQRTNRITKSNCEPSSRSYHYDVCPIPSAHRISVSLLRCGGRTCLLRGAIGG